MPPLSCLLIRHGESTANAGQQTVSHANIVLTERGRQQAQAAAERVTERPDLIVISPFIRTRQTAEPLLLRWPDTAVETWPIEEFSYLSPTHADNTTSEMRKPMVATYWQRAEPDYIDGPGAESFVAFMQRVQAFHRRLQQQQGRVVVFGHGQFFRAFLLGTQLGYETTHASMLHFRKAESSAPITNGQLIEISPSQLGQIKD